MKPNILVTAGPTWMGIDKVRVITNIFSGRTGTIIAQEFAKRGFNVKLLLGGERIRVGKFTGLKVVKFLYFDQLEKILREELSNASYMAVIHSAAVSDYRVIRPRQGKIRSGKNKLLLELKPAPKLIKMIRAKASSSLLVQFKLEASLSDEQLTNKAYCSLIKNKADIVVANHLKDFGLNTWGSFIINRERRIIKVFSRKSLAVKLVNIIKEPGGYK